VLSGLSLARGAAAQEWFDSYERGVSELRLGRGSAAASLLERAVRLRPEPGTKVLTYGTNRIERYHPYLRLAEAYLLAGNLALAHDALRRSEQKAKEPAAERDEIAARIALASTAPSPALTASAPRAAEPPPTTLAAVATPAPSPTSQATHEAPPPSTLGASVPSLPTPTPRAPAEPRVSASPSSQPSVAVPREVTGSLIVYSQPASVPVYLDDELLGITDPRSGRLVKSQVAPGSHRVRWQRDGFVVVEKTVLVASAEPAVLRAELAQQPPASNLRGLLLAAAVVVLAGLLWVFVRPRAATARPAALETESRTGTFAAATPAPRTRTTGPPADPFAGETRATSRSAASTEAEEMFGPFRLMAQLGKGGMAAVFEVEKDGEIVALKRPLAGFLEDPEFLERFLREAEIGRTLHHPNIIRIFERGNVGAVPYFTMELVGGETLQQRLKRDGAFEPRLAASVVSQVAEALDYAHLKGVVHRDLKPSNIMLLEGGTAKVMDYGIARARKFDGLTVTGAFLGTPDYVAPEIAEGKGADARSDLYSLGVVFYELLTGQKPFVGQTPFETLRKHCNDAPTPPSVIAPGIPRELEAIILKLLNKRPEDRHPGAEELLIELREYLNHAR